VLVVTKLIDQSLAQSPLDINTSNKQVRNLCSIGFAKNAKKVMTLILSKVNMISGIYERICIDSCRYSG
jgi:hypothetical protein